MSRLFDSAGPSYGLGSFAPVTATPCTLACWAYPTTNPGSGDWFILGVADSSVDDRGVNLGFQASTLKAYAYDQSAGVAVSSVGATVNTWNHVCGVFDTNNSRTAYLNGGNAGTDSNTGQGLATANRTGVNILPRLSGAGTRDGRVSNLAIWNVALTVDEIAALARGVSPIRIRRQSLVWYPAMGIGSPEPDLSGNGYNLPLTGSPPIADHPPVMAPFGADEWVRYVPSGNVTVTPGVVALSLAALAPVPVLQALPGAVALALSGLAPLPTLQALPGAVATSLSAPAPTPTIKALPSAVGLSLGALSPTPVLQATPGAIALALNALAATPGIQASPGAIALLLSVLAPTIQAGSTVTVTPSTVALALSALVPSPTIQVTPGTVALALLALGATPAIRATPGAVALLLAALAPTITGPGGVTVTPGAVALVLSALAPAPVIQARPSTVALALQVLAIVIGQRAARALPTNRGQAIAGPTDRSY